MRGNNALFSGQKLTNMWLYAKDKGSCYLRENCISLLMTLGQLGNYLKR